MERLTPEREAEIREWHADRPESRPEYPLIHDLLMGIDALRKELGEARQAAIEIAHRKAQSEIDLRAELHAWENYWGPDVREKTSAEIASLRAQVDVLAGALFRNEGPFDLTPSAIAERLEAERELREAIDDVISWFGPGLKRLKAAAKRMWPSGKGEK